MNSPVNVLSLFDGISCARVALDRAGIKVGKYYASEVDKYAIQVSSGNWVDVMNVGDVRLLESEYRRNVYKHPNGQTIIPNDIDLLIGGSPCQDLSIAKKDRKGLDGDRSSLFWEYVRILREVKPTYFILENVASMPQDAKDTITRELGVEPIMINAALVGAQNRKRLFWTNIPGVKLPDDRGVVLKDILQVDRCEKNKSNTIRSSGRGSGVGDKHNRDAYIVQKGRGFNKGGEHHDKSPTLTSNHWQENNKLTIRIGQIGKGGQGDRIYSTEGKSVCLSAHGGGRGAKTGLYKVGNMNPSGRGMGGDVYSDEGKSPTITTNKGEGRKILQDGEVIRKLTPIECERLQGLPDNYTEGISNTQRYKCLGNAFNVDVVAHILSFIK